MPVSHDPIVQASQRETLERARAALADRELADREYRAAVQTAARAGVTYVDIARALGISRQSVRQMVLRS